MYRWADDETGYSRLFEPFSFNQHQKKKKRKSRNSGLMTAWFTAIDPIRREEGRRQQQTRNSNPVLVSASYLR
jgi:hypothetical protein